MFLLFVTILIHCFIMVYELVIGAYKTILFSLLFPKHHFEEVYNSQNSKPNYKSDAKFFYNRG